MKTLATSIEDEIARYDAEIAAVRAQLDAAVAETQAQDTQRMMIRSNYVLPALERGRAAVEESAKAIWNATLAARGVTFAGGAA